MTYCINCAHLARQGNIGFAELPWFLTEEIMPKLSTVPALVPAIDALRNGLAVMMNPLMDIQFPSAHNIDLHLLFALPEMSSTEAVHTMEQLVPISYRSNGLCYGETIVRHDLVDEPGLPYDFHGDVIQTALKTAIFTSQQPLPPMDSCPYKGYTEHSDAGLPHPSRRRLCQRPHMGLTDCGCPLAHRMFGRCASTEVTTSLFAPWFAG